MAENTKKISKDNSRWSKINRELLLFLVFLVIAVVFWIILTFRNSTAVSLEYNLKINGIPNSVIVTSKIPDKVSVRLHGRGFELIKLIFSRDKVLEIDYSSLKENDKALVINEDVWKRAFDKILPSGISVNERALPRIEIYYSDGQHKLVPVKVVGNIKAEREYIIGDVKLNPEFVEIYAPQDAYDTITYINSHKINLINLKDTTDVDLKLEPPVGVKCIPDKVKAKVCVDLQTTKQIQIPIYTVNIPQNIILKPFPMTVTVTYQVSASKYNEIRDEQFNAVIDYTSIKESDTKCSVKLVEMPEDVSNVRYSPHTVDYIIEQTSE